MQGIHTLLFNVYIWHARILWWCFRLVRKGGWLVLFIIVFPSQFSIAQTNVGADSLALSTPGDSTSSSLQQTIPISTQASTPTETIDNSGSKNIFNSPAGKKFSKYVKVTGGIAVQFGAYKAWGITNRRNPFTYLLTGNVNINIAGINLPFSVVVSEQETRFRQPFNQYGVSPSYKWVTLHGGYRSLRYSQFTLNNHLFLGVGADLTPELKKGTGWKLRISGMWGILNRAVEYNAAQTSRNYLPTYKRSGFAARLGVEKRGSFLDFIFLRAADEVSSLKTAQTIVTPEENLVLGVSGQLNVFKRRLVVKGDFAASAYTRDTRSEKLVAGAGKFFSGFGSLFTPRLSSYYDYALRTEANYNSNNFSVGLAYGRITGNYRTMGSYYFQNDVEDLAANFSLNHLKGKANLTFSLGLQRTNLSRQKQTTNKRLIGSLTYNIMIKEKLQIGVNLSNYSSHIQYVRNELSDSFNLYQITQNYSLSLNYSLGRKKGVDNSLWANAGYQQAHEKYAYDIAINPNRFYNASLGHTVNFSGKGLVLNYFFAFSLNQSLDYKTYNYGPSVSLSKQLLKKKIRLAYMFTYLRADNSGITGASHNNLFRNTLTGSYAITKHHALRVNVTHFTKLGGNTGVAGPFSELRGEIRYEFTF